MKQATILLLCLAAANLGGRLHAQPGGPPAAPAPAMTKIGVINMAQLYTKCERIKAMKIHIEKQIEPYKKKKDELEKLANDWAAALKNNNSGLKQEEKDRGVQVIKECQRQLEDLQFKFNRDVAKKLEDDMAQLTKSIDDSVKRYAAAQRFHLVVAYGEPDPPLPADLGFQRTVRAIDRGYLSPIFFPSAIDITQDLVTQLNNTK